MEPSDSGQNWSAVSDPLERHLQRAASYMPLEGIMAMVVHMLEDHLTAEELEAAVHLMHRRCVTQAKDQATEETAHSHEDPSTAASSSAADRWPAELLREINEARGTEPTGYGGNASEDVKCNTGRPASSSATGSLTMDALPPVDTLPQDRAPATPPVPGPNPWMALVETTAADEEAADEETVACTTHPAATTLAAAEQLAQRIGARQQHANSGSTPTEVEPSASTGPAANDRAAALRRRVGTGPGQPLLEQQSQPVLPSLQDHKPTLELEGLTSLGMARALMQPVSLAASSVKKVTYHRSSEPAQARQVEIEGSSSLIVANCCRLCTSLLIVCHTSTLNPLLRFLPSMWISLGAVAAAGMPGCPHDQAYKCYLTNGIPLSGKACTLSVRGSGQAELGARCRLKPLHCSVIANPRMSRCGREPSCPTCGLDIAAYARSGHSTSLAEGLSSPSVRNHNGSFATGRSNQCAWALPHLALLCHVRMQCMMDFTCLTSCHVLPHAWMSGTSAPTLCASTPSRPWLALQNCHPLDLTFHSQGCQCIGASTDQASVKRCFDWSPRLNSATAYSAGDMKRPVHCSQLPRCTQSGGGILGRPVLLRCADPARGPASGSQPLRDNVGRASSHRAIPQRMPSPERTPATREPGATSSASDTSSSDSEPSSLLQGGPHHRHYRDMPLDQDLCFSRQDHRRHQRAAS